MNDRASWATDSRMAKTASSPKVPLHALTGMRFIAALHVVIFHCAAWTLWPVPAAVKHVAGQGFVSVSLFFVLSGFILAYTYTRPGHAKVKPAEFYAARFARIYPVYVLGLVVALPFFLAHHFAGGISGAGVGRFLLEAGAVLGLVQAYAPDLGYAWNAPGWSLSAEATFYLLFPIFAPALVAMPRKSAVVAALALFVFALAAPLLYIAMMPDGAIVLDHTTTATWLDVLKFNPLVRAPEFFIGVLAGRFYVEGLRPSDRAATWIGAGCVAFVVGLLALGDVVPFPLVHNGLLAPVYATLIVCLATGAGPIARFFATKRMVMLGEASYALYILHIPLYVVSGAIAKRVFGAAVLTHPVFIAVFVVGSVVASIVAFRLVEDPARKLVRARLDGLVRGKRA